MLKLQKCRFAMFTFVIARRKQSVSGHNISIAFFRSNELNHILDIAIIKKHSVYDYSQTILLRYGIYNVPFIGTAYLFFFQWKVSSNE